MNGHTEGPWHLVLSDNATPHIMHEQGGDWTDVENRSALICAMPAEIMEGFNSLNNARLMTASPAMLEALIHAEAILTYAPHFSTNKGGKGPNTTTEHARRLVRAAISKATLTRNEGEVG